MGDLRLREINIFMLEDLVHRILLLFLILRHQIHFGSEFLDRTPQLFDLGINSGPPPYQLLHRLCVRIQRQLEGVESFSICGTILCAIGLHLLHQIRQILDRLLHLR